MDCRLVTDISLPLLLAYTDSIWRYHISTFIYQMIFWGISKDKKLFILVMHNHRSTICEISKWRWISDEFAESATTFTSDHKSSVAVHVTMGDDEIETEIAKDLFIGSWEENQYKRVGLNGFLSERGNIWVSRLVTKYCW